MIDSSDIVARYVALWNEPDADERRTAIVALWAEDGVHYAPSHTCQGYTAIEARVTGAYERFVGSGDYVFRHAGNVETHHNVMRFNWLMIPAKGGAPAAKGFDLFVLGDDGRIQADYQFNDPLPQ